MKKTYNSPTVKVVKTKMQRILVGSETYSKSSAKGMTSGSFGGRAAEFSDWDEEEY